MARCTNLKFRHRRDNEIDQPGIPRPSKLHSSNHISRQSNSFPNNWNSLTSDRALNCIPLPCTSQVIYPYLLLVP